MTLIEAQRVHDAHQTGRGRPSAAEYMRYMDAKRVLAAAGMVRLTPGQIGFLKAVCWLSGMGPSADADPSLARAPAFPDPTTGEVPA